MAITGAALQAELGTSQGSPRVMREYGVVSTFQEWLIQGGAVVSGRTRFVRTTESDSAAAQAAAVLTALRA